MRKKIMLQTIILSLRKREKLKITILNKFKIMFKICFSFSLTVFMKNIEKFNDFLLIDDEALVTHCKIIKIIHKINFNKIFEIKKIINRALRQLVYFVVE